MLTSTRTPRQLAIEQAREILKVQPIYLDTETTGLEKTDEIIEISIIDHDGQTLFESLVKPSQPIPYSSTQIHGIRNEDVQSARAWPIVWSQVQNILRNRRVVIYNVEFDLRLMQQSHARYRLPWNARIDAVDMLKLYAQFRAEWDPKRRSYRYHSLANAGQQCGINLPNAHRATADTLLTRALLEYIASCQ
jgi:DNA polymerase III subunit epsilon